MGTDTTTTGTPVQPLDARRILALVALVDEAPTPNMITFIRRESGRPILSLHLDALSDASAWAAWFLVTITEPSNHGGSIWFRHSDITWHGWNVQLNANEELVAGTQLDVDTRDQLEQVAAVTVDDTAGGV